MIGLKCLCVLFALLTVQLSSRLKVSLVFWLRFRHCIFNGWERVTIDGLRTFVSVLFTSFMLGSLGFIRN